MNRPVESLPRPVVRPKGRCTTFTKPSPSAFVVRTVPRRERELGAAVGRMRIRCCRDDGFVGPMPEIKVSVHARGRCREEKEVECGLSSRHHRMSLASLIDRLPLNQSISSRTEGSRARAPGEACMEEDGISPSGLSRSIAKRCKGLKP